MTPELYEAISEAGDELSEIITEAVAGIEFFTSLLRLRSELEKWGDAV